MPSLGTKLSKAAGSDGRLKISPEKLYAEKQVREHFDEEEIQALAATIESEGQLQPVTVRPRDKHGRYLIVTGERRWRACRRLGCDVWVVEQKTKLDKSTTLIVQLIENVHRSDLTLAEQVRTVASLVNDHNVKQSEIARRMGKPKPTISKMVTIGNMPPSVEALYSNSVCQNLDTLAALTRLHEIAPEKCDAFCQKAILAGYAKRVEAEQLLRDNKTRPQEPALNPQKSGQQEGTLLSSKAGEGGLAHKAEQQKESVAKPSGDVTKESVTWIAQDPRELTLRCEVETPNGLLTGNIDLNKIDGDESFCWVSFDNQTGHPSRIHCASIRLIGFMST